MPEGAPGFNSAALDQIRALDNARREAVRPGEQPPTIEEYLAQKMADGTEYDYRFDKRVQEHLAAGLPIDWARVSIL